MNLEVLLDPQPRKPPTMELSWSTARRIMTLIAPEVALSTPAIRPRARDMLDEVTSGTPPDDTHRRLASVYGAADAGLLLAAEYEPVLPGGAPKMLMLQTLTDVGPDPEARTGDCESVIV